MYVGWFDALWTYNWQAKFWIVSSWMVHFRKCTHAFVNTIFTRGQFWPSGIVVACVCLCVCMCVCVCVSVNHELVWAIIHQPFKLGLPNLDQRCKRPWLRNLLFLAQLTLTFKVKLNFKVKIYPILSMWVCPCDKSPPIEVSISKFGPKMHISTVKVPIDFGLIDLDLQFHF